ncbi:MAG TPA: AAA family ATPase [Lacunisphaera sp.]|nr:AAA family ATPase [Lacunisphaera sp.]
MIAAIEFRNFKALRSAAVKLEPFNLLVGPSGSGKTSLIQALLRLRALAGLPAEHVVGLPAAEAGAAQITFHFQPPYQELHVVLHCAADEIVCNRLAVEHPPGLEGERLWAELRARLLGIRAFLFDHYAMGVPPREAEDKELNSNAGNLAAVLAAWRTSAPAAYAHLEGDFRRIMPEFAGLDFRALAGDHVELVVRPADGSMPLSADVLSQGTLHLLAILALAHAPQPPTIVCLEEADRGTHPRMLREVRDALYRLSHPAASGEKRAPVQVIATTHSPYLLDLYKDHPEEVVLAHRRGRQAGFTRLAELPDVRELLKEAHLGDLWYSGLLGGVPEEPGEEPNIE